MDIFLETERMVLRPFTPDDVDRLVELYGDPEVMRYINGGRPTPRDTIRTRHLPRLLHRHPGLGTFGYWAAEAKGTGAEDARAEDAGAFLGWFEFRPLEDDSPAVVELGYRLRAATWGRGYATEGARALIHKGFTELGVQRVTANTMTVNAASRRVMEKSGLTFVRTYFGDWPEVIDGSEHGEVEYDLTREAWERRRATSGGASPA
ncbi:GNAT family N-acetyltransferase [Streptomyces sparsogenes]|uniref:N-acetyltransferase GCN5 n=1 Tax=Streptomyces sparsogenes DSM 40356 TaxID=1331668 RepID=A0A1R1SIA9_9ACTN|nr:GNAT family N-acetyltransferase [Streptomyces sparsogenes]OMI37977.1 N-acetyltransferase GCN5 [Streptomyces sparsogenes DSM 40356]